MWAPDGSVFASLGNDGRIGLWDGRTGDRLGMVSVGDADSWTIANFQPDGHTLLIGTSDARVFTWDTRVETWVERACDIAGRNLTVDEWRDAFGDRPYRRTCPIERGREVERRPTAPSHLTGSPSGELLRRDEVGQVRVARAKFGPCDVKVEGRKRSRRKLRP